MADIYVCREQKEGQRKAGLVDAGAG